MVKRLSYLYNRNPYTWKDCLYIETGSNDQLNLFPIHIMLVMLCIFTLCVGTLVLCSIHHHQSSLWLQMTWHQMGARPSVTTMLTWLRLWCAPAEDAIYILTLTAPSHYLKQYISHQLLKLTWKLLISSKMSLPRPPLVNALGTVAWPIFKWYLRSLCCVSVPDALTT